MWRAGVRGAPGTVKRVDERVRFHILPYLGAVVLRDVSATVLRGYIATLEGECSPWYARQILTSLSNIFETAIDDKRLVRNLMRAKTVRWPKAPDEDRDAWPLATAQRVRDVINPRYRIAVVVALGCGRRQGDMFGLSPKDIDFERGVIRVRRQEQLLSGRLYFALPWAARCASSTCPGRWPRNWPRTSSTIRPSASSSPGSVRSPAGRSSFPLALTTMHGNAIRANIFNDEA
ncbi:tyrosine recombinase XerC [Streptomyces sp. NPDC057540]|uniref:site-specific integrase n=1 Tax=Streptomyces sp. NPDC057540 TaxID=3346160 RepID=UPI0036C17E84